MLNREIAIEGDLALLSKPANWRCRYCYREALPRGDGEGSPVADTIADPGTMLIPMPVVLILPMVARLEPRDREQEIEASTLHESLPMAERRLLIDESRQSWQAQAPA